MYVKTILLLLFISSILYAQNIFKNTYYINNDYVMLSDIVNISPKNDKKLFQLEQNRHTLRVKTKELSRLLKKEGYDGYTSRHRGYIQFTKRSPINRDRLKAALKRLYLKNYKYIIISSIQIEPNRYIQKLPSRYTIAFEKRSFLSRKGTLYIKTPHNKKIFFHYLINADVTIYKTKKSLKKGTLLNSRNCQKKSIILDKFRAMPIQDIDMHHYQSKHYLRRDEVITKRDVTGVDLVRRGSMVNVFMREGNIEISSSAKALQNAKLGDTIKLLNKEGKKIEVIITGKNRAEVK